jgi:hypothetical protein
MGHHLGRVARKLTRRNSMRQRSILSVAVLAIALAAGCSHKTNDAALVTNIKAQMFSDPLLKDANIQVTASNGEVTLSGSVPNDAAHLDAYKIASLTAGVVRVNDKIAVDEAQASQCTWPRRNLRINANVSRIAASAAGKSARRTRTRKRP